MKKFGLLKYPMLQKCNIGDYIQSLAAKQFLPKVDVLVSREHISDYKGDKINMIMNGWFMHNPQNWPPPELVNPCFVSFHINTLAQDVMLTAKGIEYLKSIGKPIGCRDYHTMETLNSKGIDAYFSGCLTTTLDIEYKELERNEEILFVDALFKSNHLGKLVYTKRSFVDGILKGDIFNLTERKNILSGIFSKDLLKQATFMTHMYSQSKFSEEERFELAESYLRKYAKAKLVVTSRIHCALPCLALGTPVIFLNQGLGNAESACRFNGILDLLNVINIDPEMNVSSNFNLPENKKIDMNTNIENPSHYQVLANSLKETCRNFVDNLI